MANVTVIQGEASKLLKKKIQNVNIYKIRLNLKVLLIDSR